MSLHIDRKCMHCGVKHPNDIYVNWSDEALADEELMDEFYNKWECVPCKVSQ